MGKGATGVLRVGFSGSATYGVMPQIARLAKQVLPGLSLDCMARCSPRPWKPASGTELWTQHCCVPPSPPRRSTTASSPRSRSSSRFPPSAPWRWTGRGDARTAGPGLHRLCARVRALPHHLGPVPPGRLPAAHHPSCWRDLHDAGLRCRRRRRGRSCRPACGPSSSTASLTGISKTSLPWNSPSPGCAETTPPCCKTSWTSSAPLQPHSRCPPQPPGPPRFPLMKGFPSS